MDEVQNRPGFDLQDPDTWRPVDLDEDEYDYAVVAMREAIFWEAASTAMQHVHEREERLGNRYPAPQVCRAYLWAWLELRPMQAGMVLENCTDERWRADATVALAGWNAGGMREGANPDLDRALTRFGGSYRDQLYQQIAGATVVSWYALRAEDQMVPRKLRSRAQAEMAGDVEPRKKVRRPDGSYDSVPSCSWSTLDELEAPDDVEAFVLREKAKLAAFNSLAPREAELFQLHLSGYSHAEIAEITDVRIGTVGATLDRARTKIKRLGMS